MNLGVFFSRFLMVMVLVCVSVMAKANDCELAFYTTNPQHYAKP